MGTSDIHAVATGIHLENGYTDYRQEELFYKLIGNEPSLPSIMSYTGIALFGQEVCNDYATENVIFYTDFSSYCQMLCMGSIRRRSCVV
jgi:hypothetical protein